MRRRNVVVVILAMVLLSAGAAASKRVRVPTMNDLATVWVGASPMSVEYLRLELTESGKGILTVQYLPEHPARAYRVTRTTLTKYRVVFEVQPAEPDAAPIYLRGDAIPGHLEPRNGRNQSRLEKTGRARTPPRPLGSHRSSDATGARSWKRRGRVSKPSNLSSPDKNKARSGMRGRNVLMVVLTLVLVSAGAAASKRVRVPTTKDLATVWVGASPISVEYLRLELTESGKGILTVQYLPEHPARAYRVTRTTLTKYRVVFEVQPVEPDAAPTISGVTRFRDIRA